MINKVYEALKQASAEPTRSLWLLGVSGGADSVSLLHAMHHLGLPLKVIHCNFHLRGAESDADGEYVLSLCRHLGVECETVDFDVESYRRENKVSVEMACRDLRYEYFERRLSETGACRIVVAHNADDNVETLLLNLFRGSGVKGLAAMRPDTGKVIRPLLGVSRGEIEEYVRRNNLEFRTDSTNLSVDYKRNFIRLELLPLIETRWPGVRKSILTTISNMRAADGQLEKMKPADAAEGTRIIEYDDLPNDSSLAMRCYELVSSLGGNGRRAEEVYRYLANPDRIAGAEWVFEHGSVTGGRKGIRVVRGKEKQFPAERRELFEAERFEMSADLMERIKRAGNNELWIGEDPSQFDFRPRFHGDRIYPLGMKGSRLVNDLLAESGVEPWDKEKVTVVTYRPTGNIVWVEGLRRSRHNLVDPDNDYVWLIKRISESE